MPAFSAGTPAGTVIDNFATVDFDVGGSPGTLNSNTVSITVLERIDVVVTLQSGQVLVAPNETARSILYTVTNTGNGAETVQLAGVPDALRGQVGAKVWVVGRQTGAGLQVQSYGVIREP